MAAALLELKGATTLFSFEHALGVVVPRAAVASGRVMALLREGGLRDFELSAADLLASVDAILAA